MKAPKHPREDERVAALRFYDILDTPKEHDFDDIATLAAAICQTEAATITFIDADRQWFKAEVGLPPGHFTLELSLCAHAIVSDGILEIADTRDDPRTSDNPNTKEPINLRFYAGAPLISTSGFPIGTLCVLGSAPKHLTQTQSHALQVLAHQVMVMLNLKVALKTADILRKEVDHRVKNSLQLIGSLISMQRRAAPSRDVKDALSQTRERVLALASLHDTMQQADSGRSVNLNKLVEDLCALFRKSLTDHVTIAADVADIEVSAKVASSLAVIINEFASNSIKHAFAEGATGTIHFACALAADGQAAFVCTDTGKGFGAAVPGGADGRGGLGFVAMHASADQINGALAFEPVEQGCRVVLRFDPAGGHGDA